MEKLEEFGDLGEFVEAMGLDSERGLNQGPRDPKDFLGSGTGSWEIKGIGEGEGEFILDMDFNFVLSLISILFILLRETLRPTIVLPCIHFSSWSFQGTNKTIVKNESPLNFFLLNIAN